MNRAMCGMAAALIFAAASASAATEQQKFGVDSVGFGRSAAMSGATAIIGAPNSDRAYVYVRGVSEWVFEAELEPWDDAAAVQFGISVALDGDTAVVAARLDDESGTDTGAVYVFTRTGMAWAPQAKIMAPDVSDNAQFGDDVSLSGETLIVGAPGDTDVAMSSGSAHIYVRSGTTWTREQRIIADSDAYDQFGASVAVEDDTAVVGMGGVPSGNAFVFGRSQGNWTKQAELKDSQQLPHQSIYPAALSMKNERIAISWTVSAIAPDGAAILFGRDGATWTQEALWIGDDENPGDRRFGASIALGEDFAIVGATRTETSDGATGAGHVYRYDGAAWIEAAILEASDAVPSANMGAAVATNGEEVIVCASSLRSAYVYSADVVPPAVSSITHLLGLSEPGLVTFTVTFSEPVTGVDASDFAIDADGPTGGSIVSVEGSGADYTVVIDTGSGTGAVTLTLVDDDSILDDGSNPLGGAGIGNGAYSAGIVVDIVAELPAADAKALMFLGLCLMTLAAIAMVRAMGRRA